MCQQLLFQPSYLPKAVAYRRLIRPASPRRLPVFASVCWVQHRRSDAMSRRTPERVRVTTHSLRILLPQTSKVTQQPNIPRFPDTRV